MDDELKGYENLVVGIVKLAITDYKYGSDKHKQDAEEFFKSDWFFDLTGFDGNYVIRQLKGVKACEKHKRNLSLTI